MEKPGGMMILFIAPGLQNRIRMPIRPSVSRPIQHYNYNKRHGTLTGTIPYFVVFLFFPRNYIQHIVSLLLNQWTCFFVNRTGKQGITMVLFVIPISFQQQNIETCKLLHFYYTQYAVLLWSRFTPQHQNICVFSLSNPTGRDFCNLPVTKRQRPDGTPPWIVAFMLIPENGKPGKAVMV